MLFLLKEFGSSPIIDGKVQVVFCLKLKDHAFMMNQGKNRVVKLEVLNLYPTEHHFIVHEIFHAYFQDNTMLSTLSREEIEAWATYAQYRYKYRNIKNREIKMKLIRKFHLTKEKIKSLHNNKNAWYGDPYTITQKYIVNALFLFSQPHLHNYKIYRKMLGRK